MNLREKLTKNKFVITAELSPPKGPDVTEFLKKARALKGFVDGVNMTDNNRAVMCMSPVSAGALLVREGLEPIVQVTCRDRNRMALQSDLLGAHALGIRDIVALRGDPVRAGDHPDAKEVFDVDSLQLMKAVSDLNRGINLAGKELNGKTEFFIGAAANPGANDLGLEVLKFEKKVECGAQFFQTQGIYIIESFKKFMDQVRALSPKVIAGVILLKSGKMARFLNERVPGVRVPEEFIDRLDKAKDPLEVGLEIAVETVRTLRGIASGAHLMCIGREDLVPEIINRSKP